MKPVTILIAESDPTVSRVLERALRAAGHETLHAADGRRALEILRDRRVDGLIADLRLPLVDGRELSERLLEQGETPRPFVVITTARSGPEVHRCVSALEGARLLEKPVSPRQLVRLVTERIEGRTSGDGVSGEEHAA